MINLTKKILALCLIGLSAMAFQSCKAKKAVVKPPVAVAPPSPPVEEKIVEPSPVKKEEEKPAPIEKPNFNIANVQFEFNSFVLKTASLPILDRAIAEMKKAPDTKFILNGHSSAEGSASHNLSLSVDRANAVKSYFVNAGLNAANFKIVGHGDKDPISSNANEAGRMLNRRTEIEVAN
ncbi:OmpA family protein [Pedobacter sp. Du54]|uniref:OmpA family protein n=1 Tax=Pedobacter anseongensis TaxID=3133439 RepID=UPI0030A9927A